MDGPAAETRAAAARSEDAEPAAALGLGGSEQSAPTSMLATEWPPTTMPDPGDEAILRGLKQTLAEIAAAQRGEGADLPGSQALIDAALLSARTELLTGGGERLREEIPNFVYLLVLSLAGQAEAEEARADPGRRLVETYPTLG